MERIKISLPAVFSFNTTVRVRITDLNYGGHVGNDSFLALVHEARQQFLNQHGYGELSIEGFGMIMTDMQAEFKKELNYRDEVMISVAATGFNTFGFDLFYLLEIITEGRKITAAKVKTGMLLYDYNNKKLVPVSENIKAKLLAGAAG